MHILLYLLKSFKYLLFIYFADIFGARVSIIIFITRGGRVHIIVVV